MRRHLVDVVVLLVLGTAVAAFLLGVIPGSRGYVLTGYVVFLGALMMLVLVMSVRDAVPRRGASAFDLALATPARPARPPAELERIVREVTMASTSAYDLHYRLLPSLREIARARLEQSGRTPGPATLDRWWELLRPDRPPPDERFGGGISPADLRALVADLEKL